MGAVRILLRTPEPVISEPSLKTEVKSEIEEAPGLETETEEVFETALLAEPTELESDKVLDTEVPSVSKRGKKSKKRNRLRRPRNSLPL
jgi:hypothetical protein